MQREDELKVEDCKTEDFVDLGVASEETLGATHSDQETNSTQPLV